MLVDSFITLVAKFGAQFAMCKPYHLMLVTLVNLRHEEVAKYRDRTGKAKSRSREGPNMKSSHPPPPPLLTTSRVTLLKEAFNTKLIALSPQGTDKIKYCQYYQNYSHTTESCLMLRDKIKEYEGATIIDNALRAHGTIKENPSVKHQVPHLMPWRSGTTRRFMRRAQKSTNRAWRLSRRDRRSATIPKEKSQ
ncbi:hypothetical protein CR513_01367, partial [Mucuna pruriens]